MLDLLFDLPAAWQLLCLVVYGCIALGVNFLLLRYLHQRYAQNARLLPVAPAFQVLTVLFALLLGFLAADIWAQQRQAVDAAFKEGIALKRLYALNDLKLEGPNEALAMLGKYRMAVAQREWGDHFNRTADPEAASALDGLRRHSVRMSSTSAPAFVISEWVRSVNELEEARHRRLLIGADVTDSSQWWVILVLTFFVLAALAACHMDRPPAGRLIMTLFMVAVVILLWQLARHTNPYNGGDIRIPLPPTLSQSMSSIP